MHKVSLPKVLINRNLLFKFNFSASVFELFFERLSIGFGQAFFDGVGSAIDQILSLFQTQTGQFFNGFDNCEFVSAGSFQYNIERCFFFGCGSTAGCGSSNSNSSCGCGFNAIFLFEDLSQLVYFFYGQVYQLFCKSFQICHFRIV